MEADEAVAKLGASPGVALNLRGAKGTYVLVAFLADARRVEIGALGEFEIPPGFFAYVGSAFGFGGLAARLAHHLASTARPHWHLDYFLRFATPCEIWWTTADRKLERRWARLFQRSGRFRVPIPRFGASDDRQRGVSHLFHCLRRPSFAWFRREAAGKTAGFGIERCLVPCRQQPLRD